MKHPALPEPSDLVKQKYAELISDLDSAIDEKNDGILKDKLKCGPGCSSCCERFSLLPIEAFAVQNAAKENREDFNEDPGKCVLLINDLCTVYESRPVICRTQGLALAYINHDEGTIEVSACPINFPDDFEFTMDHLLDMDSFNGRLAEINLQYCEESGLEPLKRIPIPELA